MSELLSYLKTRGVRPLPRIICKDGFSLSVQAGKGLYCSPREDNAYWTHVEVGFPSEEIPEFMEYAEDSNAPTDTVYSNVPIDLVEKVIMNHGGF